MKRLVSITAIFAFAVFAISAAVVGGSRPVSAVEACTNGSKNSDFEGSYSGRDTMTVQTKDGRKLCKDVNVNFTTFEVLNKNYNGKGFRDNPTAIPQKLFYNKTVTLKKGTSGKTTVTVKVPDACTPYQIDAYVGPVQNEVTTSAGLDGGKAIVGKLFQRTKTDCSEPPVSACNTETGVIEKVAKGKENTAPHSTDMAKCQNVRVCDPATGNIITVKAAKEDEYKPVGDEACKLNVCDPETGDIIKVDKSKVSQYKPVDDEACKEEPQVLNEEAPKKIADTGPAEALSAILGVGSLAGAGTAYFRSHRALRKT